MRQRSLRSVEYILQTLTDTPCPKLTLHITATKLDFDRRFESEGSGGGGGGGSDGTLTGAGAGTSGWTGTPVVSSTSTGGSAGYATEEPESGTVALSKRICFRDERDEDPGM